MTYKSKKVIIKEPNLRLPALSSNNTLNYYKMQKEKRNKKEAKKLTTKSKLPETTLNLRDLSYRSGRKAVKAFTYVYKHLEIFNRKRIIYPNEDKTPIKDMLN